jgi:hypothetical protein
LDQEARHKGKDTDGNVKDVALQLERENKRLAKQVREQERQTERGTDEETERQAENWRQTATERQRRRGRDRDTETQRHIDREKKRAHPYLSTESGTPSGLQKATQAHRRAEAPEAAHRGRQDAGLHRGRVRQGVGLGHTEAAVIALHGARVSEAAASSSSRLWTGAHRSSRDCLTGARVFEAAVLLG